MAFTLTLVETFAAPATNPFGLAVDGAGRMWCSVDGGTTIYEIDPANSGALIGSFVVTFPGGGGLRGLTYDPNLDCLVGLIPSPAGLHRIDKNTGTVLQSLSSPGSIRQGLGFDYDNNTWWQTDTGNVGAEPVINVNPTTGGEIRRFNIDGVPRGVLAMGGFVYVSNSASGSVPGVGASTNRVFRCEKDGTIIDWSNQLAAIAQNHQGMCFDGTSWWFTDSGTEVIRRYTGFDPTPPAPSPEGWRLGLRFGV